MNSGGHGRRSLLHMTPMFLLVLGLHLQGSASRCIDTVLGEDLQPLPPGVQRCSVPRGLLQPDVPQPGQGGGSSDGGGNRIVGGSPAGSGSSGNSGNYGGGYAGVGGPPPMDGPYPPDGPNKLGPFGRPIGPIIASGSSQSGGSQESGQFGGGTPQYGAGPVGPGGPGGSSQYAGNPGQYGGPNGYGRGYSRLGHLKPVAKPPSIPYIPSPREWGGGRIPVPRDSPPNGPYGAGQYGGAAGSYGGAGGSYGGAGSYGGGTGGSYGGGAGSYNPSTYNEPVGPRGREDGSYGPVPQGPAPGSQSNKDIPLDRDTPCQPNKNPC